MSTSKWVALVLIVIILIVVIILTILLSYKFPGLFMSWPENSKHNNWCTENIGEKLFNSQQLSHISENIKTEPIRWVNGTLGTIGTAAYIDGNSNTNNTINPYCSRSQITNTQLEKYSPMYDKLLDHLSERLPGNKKCVFAAKHTNNSVALPGFHVFKGNSPLGKGYAVASVHVDMQEYNVPWSTIAPDETFDMTETYSFTLPISVPSGCGLYLLNKKDTDVRSGGPLWWSLWNAKRQKIYYDNGYCYLHHGKNYHMIAPYYAKNKDGSYNDRITLQGHILYCSSKDEYWVYW